MKTCIKCKETKSLDSFYVLKGKNVHPGRYTSDCKDCVSKYHKARYAGPPAGKKERTPRNCAECGIEFLSKIDAAFLCSGACRSAKGIRERGLNACDIPGCGKPVMSRGWCPAHYMRFNTYGDPLGKTTRFADLRAERVKPCGQCAAAFYPKDRGSKYCSRICSVAAQRVHAAPADERKVAALRRVARVKSASTPGKPVRKLEIFERDGWICYLCGEETIKDAHWRNPRAPSLDHAVSVSRGGTNTPDNVFCTHRSCNGAKAAKPWIYCTVLLQ